MGTWLELYDILIWKKNGKYFVSRNDSKLVFSLTTQKYELVGDLQEFQGWCSKELDEAEGAIELPNKF
jgi:hypothetical protein